MMMMMMMQAIHLSSHILLPSSMDHHHHLIASGAAALLLLFLLLSFRLLRSLLLNPLWARRSLLAHGFHVLPYFPIAGDLPQIRRLQSNALLSPLPSPSHHHLLYPRLYPFFHHHFSAHGDDAPLVFWWGPRPTVVLTHPDNAKSALSADVQHFDRADVSRAFRPLLGNGLLLLDRDEWQRHRNILRPAFFADRLKDMVGHMTTSAMEMIGDWQKQLLERQGFGSVEIEVSKPIKDTAADILSRTLFGTNYRRGKAVFEMQMELLKLIVALRARNSIIPGYRFLPTRGNRRVAALETNVTVLLRDLVESRLHSLRRQQEDSHLSTTSCATEPDLLGLIVAAEVEEAKNSRSDEFAIESIVDECKTFFFAGHETTASLLAWTMLLLSLHEEWQERARREVMEVCGGPEEESLQPQALSRLKIVGMVLNETLRLYPPVPQYGRRDMNPGDKCFKLGTRTMPRGTTVVVDCLYIHRRKDIWGEDADEFKPDRFSNGVGEACKHPYGFLPFGIGPRHCIGQNFAMLEAKVMLSLILKHFKFRLSPTYVHAPVVTITMRPMHGLQLILEPVLS